MTLAAWHIQGGKRAGLDEIDAAEQLRLAREVGYHGPLPPFSSLPHESRAQGPGDQTAAGSCLRGWANDGRDGWARKAVMEQSKQQVAEAILLLDRVHRGGASPYSRPAPSRSAPTEVLYIWCARLCLGCDEQERQAEREWSRSASEMQQHAHAPREHNEYLRYRQPTPLISLHRCSPACSPPCAPSAPCPSSLALPLSCPSQGAVLHAD